MTKPVGSFKGGAMWDVLGNTAIVIFGVAIVAFRRTLARIGIKHQNQLFGFDLGERQERISRSVFLLVGAGFVVMGVLLILGVG